MLSGLFSNKKPPSAGPGIKEAMLNFSRTMEDSMDENLFLWGGAEAPGQFLSPFFSIYGF